MRTPVLPDAYIEYWCDQYHEHRLHLTQVPLLAFLRQPALYLDLLTDGDLQAMEEPHNDT